MLSIVDTKEGVRVTTISGMVITVTRTVLVAEARMMVAEAQMMVAEETDNATLKLTVRGS